MDSPCTFCGCIDGIPTGKSKTVRYRKALEDIIKHMEIVTNKPEMSTVYTIAKRALDGMGMQM